MAIGSSRLRSLQLPVTPASGAVRLAQAAIVPVRVVVAISGPAGGIAFLAFDAGALNPVSDSFVSAGFSLGVGASETFVVAPGQILFVVGNVSGMSAAVAESDAVPFDDASADGASGGSGIPSVQIQALGGAAGISFNNEDWIEIHPNMGLVEVRYPGQRAFIKALAGAVAPRVSMIWPGSGGQPNQVSGTVSADKPIIVPLWGPRATSGSSGGGSTPSQRTRQS